MHLWEAAAGMYNKATDGDIGFVDAYVHDHDTETNLRGDCFSQKRSSMELTWCPLYHHPKRHHPRGYLG